MTDFKKKIEDLWKQIANLEAKLESEKQDEQWWPEDGGEYFFIGCLGIVFRGINSDPDETLQHSRYSISGLFKTKGQADTFKKVHDRYGELMEGVTLDWEDEGTDKYYLHFPREKVIYDIDVISQTQGTNYMTKEVKDKLFEEFTQDELKIWVLGGARR